MGRIVGAGTGNSSMANLQLQFNDSPNGKRRHRSGMGQSGDLASNDRISHVRDSDTGIQLSPAFNQRTPPSPRAGSGDSRGLGGGHISSLVLQLRRKSTPARKRVG